MNRFALITGGSRGIGRGIALELAALGYDLLLSYRSNQAAAAETASQCEQIADRHGRAIRVEHMAGSVADPAARAALLDRAERQFKRLDLLVNNAGIAPRERVDLLETGEESFDELLGVNLKGPFFLTQACARWMLRERQRSGDDYRPKIVTINSISAYTASVNRAEYCVSKAGLAMLTPLFAARLAEGGVTVFEIRPGIIATDMTAGVRAKYDELIRSGLTPIRRWGQPDDVARAVAAIALDHLPFSTGEVINVDGGFHLRQL